MNNHLRLITTITLPLLFTIGCVSTDNKPFASVADEGKPTATTTQKDQANVNESVKLAINNMDGYLNRLEQEQDADVTSDIERHLETAPTEEITDMTVLIVEEGMGFEDISETLTATESKEIDQLIEAESTSMPVPDQTKFFFGFNKTQPNEADKKALAVHAAYLLSNPNTVLVINGHADNRGNKNYNQYLSLLRAESIAAILTAAGVPGNQLRVGGMGDNVPMVAVNHWGENRRVELLYRDALMLSSQ